MANRSQWADFFLVDMLPQIHHLVIDTFNSKTDKLQFVYQMAGTTNSIEQSTTGGSFPAAQLKNEGTSVNYFDPKQGFDKTYTMVTFALGFRTTMEMMQDQKHGLTSKFSRQLGKAMFESQQIRGATVWNTGFTTNGADGVPLFSTLHPLLGGGVEANTPAAQVDLSQTAIEDALILLSDTRDDEGKHIALSPKLLLIPPAYRYRAREIINSNLKSGTANNDINALKEDGLTIVEWDFLTDLDAWFLGPMPSDGDMWWFNRMAPTVESDFDFDTGDGKTKITGRWDNGYGEWREWYGSSGA